MGYVFRLFLSELPRDHPLFFVRTFTGGLRRLGAVFSSFASFPSGLRLFQSKRDFGFLLPAGFMFPHLPFYFLPKDDSLHVFSQNFMKILLLLICFSQKFP